MHLQLQARGEGSIRTARISLLRLVLLVAALLAACLTLPGRLAVVVAGRTYGRRGAARHTASAVHGGGSRARRELDFTFNC
jgi:hypothetical protein